MLIPVILAGGSGSRLWPLSRSAYPKQLIPLISNSSMLQETALRAKSIKGCDFLIVICNKEHRFLVQEQLEEINIHDAKIILEPCGRNTAPAATIAALFVADNFGQDSLMLVMPADHSIKDNEGFLSAIKSAKKNAEVDKLVTFGVKPLAAETGYGYIKTSPSFNEHKSCNIIEFIEKPKLEIAEKFVSSKQYYWNSGMFLYKADTWLKEVNIYQPELLDDCRIAKSSIIEDANFYHLDEKTLSSCENISIDYAVMEKTKNAVLVPLVAEWSDVGSWSALQDIQASDVNGNVVLGDIHIDDVQDSYMRAESRMLAVVGVKDHIVIETADAVLVAHKDSSQKVKDIVTKIKTDNRVETSFHKKVFRPWGYFETCDSGKNFKVKRISVKPMASLSLQMHSHRSEHWVVVKGIAEVTRGEEVSTLNANESTYIPKGVKHKLANKTNEPLEIIEVQSGDYLGEDDIVRFEDCYGRVEV